MDFASQKYPLETELSFLKPSEAAAAQNVSLPPRIDKKSCQLITDFDDDDEELELKLNEATVAKNDELDMMHTSRRLLSNQKEEAQPDSANQSTLLDIELDS